MKKIKIAIFGAALNSNNYGCTALGITQVRLLQNVAQKLNIPIECQIYSSDEEKILDTLSNYIDTNNVIIKYVVRIKTGFKGYFRLKKDIKDCDLYIDLTYGDSFADIYGKKNFYLYTLPKYLAMKAKKATVLGPQTIGPFYNKTVKKVASKILKKTSYIFARDDLSRTLAAELTERDDIFVTSDLAMELPYIKDLYSIDKSDARLNVGLNVSKLMWSKDASNSNLSVKLSYKDLIYKLLDKLKERNAKVHLITHVYDKSEYNEYSLAEDLHKKYDNTVLAPMFNNPMEAKSYMSFMDIFIGSRMHATIGAFSAGAPVIPVSYSRKFEGLYNALGYHHCIDCSKESVESALQLILDKIDNRLQLESDRQAALEIALKKNAIYSQQLEKTLKEIAQHQRDEIRE